MLFAKGKTQHLSQLCIAFSQNMVTSFINKYKIIKAFFNRVFRKHCQNFRVSLKLSDYFIYCYADGPYPPIMVGSADTYLIIQNEIFDEIILLGEDPRTRVKRLKKIEVCIAFCIKVLLYTGSFRSFTFHFLSLTIDPYPFSIRALYNKPACRCILYTVYIYIISGS